jgi:hypothetical protein
MERRGRRSARAELQGCTDSITHSKSEETSAVSGFFVHFVLFSTGETDERRATPDSVVQPLMIRMSELKESRSYRKLYDWEYPLINTILSLL